MSRSKRKRGPVRWPWLVAVVVVTLLIWRNSLFPVSESAAQSSRVVEWLTPLLSLTPLPVEHWHNVIRKLAHMTEFAALGACWTAALARFGPGGKGKLRLLLIPLACLLSAMMDETIQIFVPGRGSQVSDVWIDALGSCIGSVILLLILGLRRRKKRKEDLTQGR